MLPADVVTKTNNLFYKTYRDGSFTTVFFGLLEKTSGRLLCCCAGHPPLFIQKENGSAVPLEAAGPIIGIFEDATYENNSFVLNLRERLIMYTDGITEARRNGKFFGEKGLARTIRKNAKTPTPKLPRAILNAVVDYTGGGLADDVAMLVVELKEEGT
jgi:sigma-B regulation protein RsbU (phosphoserine phosphatase)